MTTTQRVEEALRNHDLAIERILNNHNEVDLETLHVLLETGNVLCSIVMERRRRSTTNRVIRKPHRRNKR